ncbi:MAG: LysR family transcriptional regulator [Bauldia sp.]
MGEAVELRHLRYFVAVAEEGSLTLAAERRLHTAQPSLSRQIRDLEVESGCRCLSPGSWHRADRRRPRVPRPCPAGIAPGGGGGRGRAPRRGGGEGALRPRLPDRP